MAIEFKDDTFKSEVLESNQPVLVDFWAAWCGPCRMVAPMIDSISEKFEGKAKVGKVDVDQNQKVSVDFGIRNIPTLLFFKNGEVVDKVVGVVPQEQIEAKLEALL